MVAEPPDVVHPWTTDVLEATPTITAVLIELFRHAARYVLCLEPRVSMPYSLPIDIYWYAKHPIP